MSLNWNMSGKGTPPPTPPQETGVLGMSNSTAEGSGPWALLTGG